MIYIVRENVTVGDGDRRTHTRAISDMIAQESVFLDLVCMCVQDTYTTGNECTPYRTGNRSLSCMIK